MTTLETLRNPLCEFALTLADLNDPLNYHSMAHGSESEEWLPFFTVQNGTIYRDGFLFPSRWSDVAHRTTWNSINDDGSGQLDLRRLGVVPFDNGAWSNSFALADSMAFRYIEQLLS